MPFPADRAGIPVETRVVENVLNECMGYQDGETVLIVTDRRMMDLARMFEDEARRLGVDVMLMSMTERETHGAEPPDLVAQAILGADIALLITTKSLSHTRARIRASDKGVRIASMPGADGTRLEYLLDIDYPKLKTRAESLEKKLSATREVRITAPNGTDLTFEITDRKIYLDIGAFHNKGDFGNLPAGEVCLSPVEGTARGRLVVDGSMGGLGKLPEPLDLEIADGQLVSSNSQPFERLLDKHGDGARSIGEFGIGLNPNAIIVGNTLEDEKAVGTIHIAFGNNLAFGGTNGVPCHLDGVVLKPTVELDGTALDPVEHGIDTSVRTREDAELVIPEELREVIRTLESERTYKMMVMHSGDAQYILDLESSYFILVNPAFEELTGYSLRELQCGVVNSAQLIARESNTTYKKVLERRKTVSTDRYDLRILNKDGDKIPVEIAVKKTSILGRDVVVGSCRDLTKRKDLENQLRSQMHELGRASARLFALTEKIQEVPPLTPKLLHVIDEVDLIDKACKSLTARPGLGFKGVNIYLIEDEILRKAQTFNNTTGEFLLLKGPGQVQQVARGEIPHVIASDRVLHPLMGREFTLGVLEVFLDPDEMAALENNEAALNGYLDLLQTMAQIIGIIIENIRLYEKVRRQSLVDQLSGVYNRRYLDRKLREEIRRARRYKRDLSLLIVDVDNLKTVNDTLGHLSGDALIRGVAQMLKIETREVDVVARYGGDEFVIIMPETSMENAVFKAEQLRAVCEATDIEPAAGNPDPIKTTMSIGVSSLNETASGHDSEDLLAQADAALYASKREGKNRVSTATQALGSE
jgi:diguanylate cyclase (GGDEF)-like protein/PAS domain S-box-containing protein